MEVACARFRDGPATVVLIIINLCVQFRVRLRYIEIALYTSISLHLIY